MHTSEQLSRVRFLSRSFCAALRQCPAYRDAPRQHKGHKFRLPGDGTDCATNTLSAGAPPSPVSLVCLTFHHLDPEDQHQVLCKPSGYVCCLLLDQGLALLSRNMTQEKTCFSLPPGAWRVTPVHAAVSGVRAGRLGQLVSPF